MKSQTSTTPTKTIYNDIQINKLFNKIKDTIKKNNECEIVIYEGNAVNISIVTEYVGINRRVIILNTTLDINKRKKIYSKQELGFYKHRCKRLY